MRALPPGDAVTSTAERPAGLSPPPALLCVPHSAFHHLPPPFLSFLLPSASLLLPLLHFPSSFIPLFFCCCVLVARLDLTLSPPKLITPVPFHTPRYGRAQHFPLQLGLSVPNALCRQPSPSTLWTEVSLSPSSLPPSLSLPHIIFSI